MLLFVLMRVLQVRVLADLSLHIETHCIKEEVKVSVVGSVLAGVPASAGHTLPLPPY